MKRLEHENFEDYRKRRAVDRMLDDAHLRGKVVDARHAVNRKMRRTVDRATLERMKDELRKAGLMV